MIFLVHTSLTKANCTFKQQINIENQKCKKKKKDFLDSVLKILNSGDRANFDESDSFRILMNSLMLELITTVMEAEIETTTTVEPLSLEPQINGKELTLL